MKINEIINYLESVAPPSLQESYDNSGLLVGNPEKKVSSAIVTVDVTEPVVDEAIKKQAGLIIAHHPVIFNGLKKLTGQNYIERTVLKAVKNDIAIFAAHTNLDSINRGVNKRICEKLGLQNCHILQPVTGKLKKLATFIPCEAFDRVKKAIFEAGAGHIGNYDHCGWSVKGDGSFRGNDETQPYIGRKGEIHIEKEIRFETIFPSWLQGRVINALVEAHPYEEVAYDIYTLENNYEKAGMGMVGDLQEPLEETEFLNLLKKSFLAGCIRHTRLKRKKAERIAVCGGSGSRLLGNAIAAKADFFVSSDFKYHQFFEAEDKIVIADIGHFESEQFTKEIFYELITKKFPKFAVRFSEVNTNPVFYF